MSDEKQSGGAAETISQGANAAKAIQGAVKTGKAIAGMAKGAAAGGPYGAIAMGLWQNRKTAAKIILAATFVLLLPILFILMLPSLIFGGLKSAESPEMPMMNDNAAIYVNIEDANYKVSEVLEAEHTAVLKTVQDKIDALPSDDEHEIIDHFSVDAAVDINGLIAQYCAYKDDYEEIEINDLISMIKKYKDMMFAVSETVESRKIQTDDMVEAVTVNRHIYTITYNTDFFADEVFKLDEEKAGLAKDYADNLILFLGERDNEAVSGNGTHLSISDRIKDDATVFSGGDLTAPIAGWQSHVSSEFGTRSDPFTKQQKFHTGIDIAVASGTPVYAIADGTVLYTKKSSTGYGYHLVIHHGDKITSLYAHCSELLVSGGDMVKQGDTVAKVGSTGRSTGPHLHFEVMADGVLKNPREFLP